MFRITKSEQRLCTAVIIDGELVRNYLDVAERCCRDVLDSGRTLQVMLRDVTAIDAGGKEWLATLIRQNIRVASRNLYTSYVVRELRRLAAGASS